jgi:c-di-GMP-binding flagellar brake protein YcgR
LLSLFFFIVVLLAVGFYFTRTKKENSGNWIQFLKKGREAGFTLRDLDQLKQLASACNIADPVTIFTSQKQFETIIRSMVASARQSGEINDLPVQDFLSKLFDYCKKIGMASIDNNVRISNSRQISEGQTLRVLVTGTGVYKSEVIKNFGNYLTISRPINSKSSPSMQWNGVKMSIYFWREDDAGYVFDTEVIDEVFSKGISSLKVEHNDALFRTQKRKSLRVKFTKAAFLYMVKEMDNPHKLEKTAGLKVMLDDISDTGCAFKVNGQATQGLRLKVQFSLDRIPICIPGTVRSVDYNLESNLSLVHMEADPLPIGTRNHILCEVFDLLPEDDEEELPLRVVEDEAGSNGKTDNTENDLQEMSNA